MIAITFTLPLCPIQPLPPLNPPPRPLPPKKVSVGASGSLYGLFALLLLDLVQNWQILLTPVRDMISLTVNVTIALGVGLLPFVDNFAHIGGFLAGILSGLVFLPAIDFNENDRRRKRVLRLIAFPALTAVLGYGFYAFWMQMEVGCSWCHYLDCVPPGSAWCAEGA